MLSILIPWIRNAEVLPECQKIQFDAGTGCMLSTLQVLYVKCKTNMQNPSTCCDLVALSLYLSSWFASTMGPTGFWRTLLRVSCYPYVCDAHIADTLQFHFQKVSPASTSIWPTKIFEAPRFKALVELWGANALNMWLGMYGAPTWKLIKLFSSDPFIYRLFRTDPWVASTLCVMGLGFSPLETSDLETPFFDQKRVFQVTC